MLALSYLLSALVLHQAASSGGDLPTRPGRPTHHITRTPASHGPQQRHSPNPHQTDGGTPSRTGFPPELGEFDPLLLYHHRVPGFPGQLGCSFYQFIGRQIVFHSERNKMSPYKASDYPPTPHQGHRFANRFNSGDFPSPSPLSCYSA